MSRLDELISELCPNGVSYVKLGSLCSIVTKQTGFDYSNHIKSKLLQEPSEEAVPYIQTKFFAGKRFDYNTDYYVPKEILNKFPKITLDEKCLLFSIVGASIGNVGLFPGEQICFLGGAICVAKIKPEYNVDYLYYCIESGHVQQQIRKKTKGAGQATITIEDIREFTVPFPPLEVQREIVRILDKFAEFTENLIKELTMECAKRKRQYQYYLNSFFEKQTGNMVALESIGTLTRGKRFVHADATETGVPCVHYGELYTYYGVHADTVKSHIREELRDKMRYAHKGDVIIVGAGENNIDIGIGVAWEGNEAVAVHDACYILCHSQNSKYISYYLRSDMYHNQIKKYVSEGKICSISAKGLGKAIIPIPSLCEQQRIVSILERLDVLCDNITKYIPAEIAGRHKQYEYYRDKLLTFGG